MSSCLVPEFPAVLTALEHLQELEKEMRNEKHAYSEPALQHLTEIAESIKELEQARKNVHDLLEVETIEVSKLRFKFLHLPDGFRVEIAGAVSAARESNAAQLSQLQTELKNITDEIELTEKKQSHLKKQNRFLIPELERVKAKHEEVIELLNQQMAEKASKQIILNDTYDKAREAQQKAASLRDATEDLEEDMIQERKEFAEEKERLIKEAAETEKKINIQKENNLKKRKDLDILSSRLFDQELKTNDQQKLVYRLKNHVSELRVTDNRLTSQLENEMRKNKALSGERSELDAELKNLIERFERESQLLNEKISKIEEEAETSEKLKQELVGKSMALNDKFLLVREKEDKCLARKQEIMKDLQRSKLFLEEKLELMSKLRMENKEMKEEIERLKETSQVNTEMYSKQLEDYTKQFNHQREARLSLQAKKNELGKNLEDWKQADAMYMNSMNTRIEAYKRQHNELINEGNSLQRDNKLLDEQINVLSQQLSNAEHEYINVEKTLSTEINQLENDITNETRSLQQDEEQLEVNCPILRNAETEFDAERKKYEDVKQRTADLKRKKMYLEVSIKERQQDIHRVSKPKEELKLELSNLRSLIIEQLRDQTEAVKKTEKDIYEMSLRLDDVVMENCRLKLCNTKLKDDISTLKDDTEKQLAETERLKNQRQSLYDQLLKAWAEDIYVERDYSERDHGIVEALLQLKEKTTRRGQKIGDINSKLLQGFSELTSHLMNRPSSKHSGSSD